MYDALLKNGTVIDGSGGEGYRADVAISGETIARIAPDIHEAEATTIVDVTGQVISPGFIDAHGHSDGIILVNPGADSKIAQGIVTEIMGNCGLAVAPIDDVDEALMDQLRQGLSIIDFDPKMSWGWRSMAQYGTAVTDIAPAMNGAMLAGHMSIRASVMGFDDRKATPAEITAMQELLDVALEQGAVGFSTGLMYAPCSYADIDELAAFGEIVGKHDKVFSIHMRAYSSGLFDAIDESIEIARRSGCKLQISHLGIGNEDNWGKLPLALDQIDRAIDEGIDVMADTYPYIAGNTVLTQLLPEHSLNGGINKFLERMQSEEFWESLAEEIAAGFEGNWDTIVISDGEFRTSRAEMGRTISEAADDLGMTPERAVPYLVADSDGTAAIISFGKSEEDVVAALKYPGLVLCTDGWAMDRDGTYGGRRPHPRSFATYPRLLGRYVREQGHLSLAEAIAKSTLRVAERFRLDRRGAVRPDYFADLIVFDPDSILDQATYEEPRLPALGFRLVMINGSIVVDNGELTGNRPGKFVTVP